MDQFLAVTNIKNDLIDSASTDQLEVPTEMQVDLVEHENHHLIHSKLDIKKEPQEDESEFLVIASTSYEMCPKYDTKIETDEPVIKIERNDMFNESMQNPLVISTELKVEKHSTIDLNSESRIKTEPTRREKNANLLETDEDDSQDQLLIKNDSDQKNKKYACNICNRTFTQKYNLNVHLRIHTGMKPFTCEICKKSFTLKHYLNTHMLIHSDEKPHVCDVCKKVFSQKSNLNTHMLIHRGVKPFQCNHCNKSFTNNTNLVAHKRKHTGHKPFVCNLCDNAFNYQSAFTRHKRLHTKKKPYSCGSCDKSFALKANLNRHRKIHNNL